MAEFEYQHMVPRTYYKPWEILNTKRKLNVVEKSTDKIKQITSKKMFGIKDFYTITIDNYYIFTEDDKKKVYNSLFNYNIRFENKILSTIDDFHSNFNMLKYWTIIDKNGNTISYNNIYKKLKEIRILDIEKDWNKIIESNWNDTVQSIELSIKSKTALKIKDYDFLYLFLEAQEIRTEVFKNKSIKKPTNKKLDKIDILDIPFIKKDIDQMLDSCFKEQLRSFLADAKNSVIAKLFNKLELKFYYTNNKTFYTSDNPIIDEVNALTDDKYKGLICPLTPNLIVIAYKGNKQNNQYSINELLDDEVDKINNLIVNNAEYKYIK